MVRCVRWRSSVGRSASSTLELRARQRAERCFLDEEVFATRDRTGILIFVAVFERQVVVMGDAGINRAVPDGAWDHVVDDVIAGIRARRPAEALIGRHR